MLLVSRMLLSPGAPLQVLGVAAVASRLESIVIHCCRRNAAAVPLGLPICVYVCDNFFCIAKSHESCCLAC